MIRSRLITKLPTYEGFPRPEFVRYVWRFGQLFAEFISPGMIKLDGRAPNVKNAPAVISFYNKNALRQRISESFETGVSSKHYDSALFNWPSFEDAQNLPSYVNPARHSWKPSITLANQ